LSSAAPTQLRIIVALGIDESGNGLCSEGKGAYDCLTKTSPHLSRLSRGALGATSFYKGIELDWLPLRDVAVNPYSHRVATRPVSWQNLERTEASSLRSAAWNFPGELAVSIAGEPSALSETGGEEARLAVL
jgi:hypothetical protein